MTTNHRLAVALLAIGAALTLAACGSSASPTSSSTRAATGSPATPSAFAARRAKLRACLQQHGITLPARPPGAGAGTPGVGTTSTTRRRRFFFGGGGGGGGGRGFFGANPKLRAALQACGANFGRFGAGARRRFSAGALTSFAACVRKHGYTLPKPNTSGAGPVFPRSVQSSKAFQKAATSCASILRQGFRGGPGAPPPAATPGGA